MQFYINPERENDPNALPDAEVFYVKVGEWFYDENGDRCDEMTEEPCEAGFYYWSCLPGCLPDSEPCGPYETEEEAIAEAREWFGDTE